MKKRIPFALALAALSLTVQAQEHAAITPELSPFTRLYLSNPAHRSGPLPGYVYRQDAAGRKYVSALLQATPALQEEALRQTGAIIGTKAGDIWTVQVPLEGVDAFVQTAGATYIQLDEPVFPTMDSVRKVTRVDSVQAGINLPHAFSGKNVVLGIMDVGFDYTHPLFYDTTGNRYRVRKIWEEKTVGTPPSGSIFGNELTDTMAMRARGTDNPLQSHGSHVAGIAGGSGVGSSAGNDQYRGVAFGTDVVLVGITPPQSQWMNTGMSDLIDGMNYIYSYAASVGKPAVVNLSWGCSIGSHDGLSLFSRAVDNLTGAGKLFVCSAGNTGTDNVHLQKTFAATDTLLNTFVTFDSYLGAKKTWVDIWGDSTKSFCAKITLYNGAAAGSSTGFICLDNNIHLQQLIGSDGDTCFATLVTSSASFNGKPRMLLTLYSKTADAVNLKISSSNATVNAFEGYVENSTGYYGAFSSNSVSGAVNGNTAMTTSDFSTTRSAIAVGAFAARNSFVNEAGVNQPYTGYVSRGRIVPFSSKGPSMDGRVSPDIAAPGFLVASGVNSFDTSFGAGGSEYANTVRTFSANGRTYHYAMLSGTSMSSPVVSGIVAMMLEADPTLTPQRTKDVLAQTALTDAGTGTIPAAGTNVWGHGKVNAYGAIRKLLQELSIGQTVKQGMEWSLYPNPNKGAFTISCTAAKRENVAVAICDMAGKTVMQQSWTVSAGTNLLAMNTGKLAPGLYFAKLAAGNSSSAVKMLVE